jgi:hypothetical protein
MIQRAAWLSFFLCTMIQPIHGQDNTDRTWTGLRFIFNFSLLEHLRSLTGKKYKWIKAVIPNNLRKRKLHIK